MEPPRRRRKDEKLKKFGELNRQDAKIAKEDRRGGEKKDQESTRG
jgi:hypothetical protein